MHLVLNIHPRFFIAIFRLKYPMSSSLDQVRAGSSCIRLRNREYSNCRASHESESGLSLLHKLSLHWVAAANSN